MTAQQTQFGKFLKVSAQRLRRHIELSREFFDRHIAATVQEIDNVTPPFVQVHSCSSSGWLRRLRPRRESENASCEKEKSMHF
jgi:hypothetical protein